MRASDSAYLRLRREIIEWTLLPGAPLGEVETAARIGVSRTPLREALFRLLGEGLLASDQGRTLIVARISVDHVNQLFEYREALETQAARLAARRWVGTRFADLRELFISGPTGIETINPEQPYFLATGLDEAIDEAMQNEVLLGALQDLRGQLSRLRRHARRNPERLSRATAEHLQIVDAILDRDEARAAHMTSLHLRNSLENILLTVPMLAGDTEMQKTLLLRN